MTPLEDLFPPQIRCVFSNQPPQSLDLPPAEADATRNMRAKRLREFVHGRTCARLALARLGVPECPIPVGEHRAPAWPDGIVGSISHSGNHAAAVVAYESECQGLGVDLEDNESLDESLVQMVCRPEEIDRLGRAEDKLIIAKIIFSAKECVYKCIWPTVLHFIEFQEIEIQLDTEARSFSALPHSARLPIDLIKNVRGRYVTTDELIISAAYIL
jgi:4'-phosphopantetheinyl transferase EntD